MFPCDDEIMVCVGVDDLVKFGVFDKVSGVSMVSMCIVLFGFKCSKILCVY